MIVRQLVVPSGQSQTPPLVLDNARHIVGIYVPTGWSGTAITFLVAAIDKDGVEISVTVTAGRANMLPADLLLGAQRVVFRSGTQAAPGNQSADRTLTVVLREYS
jgi:hypothetical protein